MIKKNLLVLFVLGLLSTNISAQNSGIDWVRRINPSDPSSGYWQTHSNLVKPIAIGLPLGLWAYGKLKKDDKAVDAAIKIGGTIIIAAGSTETIKRIINKPRPYQQHTGVNPDTFLDGESFPSGHTSLAFASATSLSMQYKKWYVVVPAYSWAVSVGYSRMYLGQHYPSDVIAGALVGTASAFASEWLNKKLFVKKKR